MARAIVGKSGECKVEFYWPSDKSTSGFAKAKYLRIAHSEITAIRVMVADGNRDATGRGGFNARPQLKLISLAEVDYVHLNSRDRARSLARARGIFAASQKHWSAQRRACAVFH